MNKSAFFVSIIFIWGWNYNNLLSSQTPYFFFYEIEEGYRDIKPEIIYEDGNNLLWLGTNKGPFSFDGIEFTLFNPEFPPSDDVRAIYQDKKGVYWIGYENGEIYQLIENQLLKWSPEEGTPVVPVVDFAEDNEGRLWFATYGEGVYVLDNGRLINIDTEDGLLGDEIYDMEVDPNGKIWLGTDGGINICSYQNRQKIIESITTNEGLPDDIVRELLPDGKGNFWVGMHEKGIAYIDSRTYHFDAPVDSWNGGIVKCMAIFEDLELWIGTDGNGIWRYSLEDKLFRPLGFGTDLNNSRIQDLHKDTEGNIWIVPNKSGLWRANRRFEILETPFANIQAVYDHKKNIWIGTENGLFEAKENPKTGKWDFLHHLDNQQFNVISLFVDEYENIWIGTFGNGIYIFNPSSNRLRHINEKNGLLNLSVLSIKKVAGICYLATLGGVYEIQYSDNPVNSNARLDVHSLKAENSLGANFIYQVYIDSQENPWFATDGKGVSYKKNNNFYAVNDLIVRDGRAKQIEPLNAVFSITEDKNQCFWMATSRNGLFRLNGDSGTYLSIESGVRNLEITSLITDNQGNILIVHPDGIDLMEPVNNHIIYYDQEVALDDLQPNLNAFSKNRDGKIWIAGKNKLIKYSNLKEDLRIHPTTFIEKVSVFLDPIAWENGMALSAENNNLVIDFKGIWYTQPNDVKYRYCLKGYNDNWIQTKDRSVHYSNLPPGNYTFCLSSTEGEIWKNEPIITWTFEIDPPIWKTPGFIFGGVFLGGFLFYWYQKLRDKRLQRVSLLEKEMAISQLSALQAQINPHFLFNNFNTLVGIIEEDPQSAVTYVENLSDFYRSIMKFRDMETISLNEDLEILKSYWYLINKRFGESIIFEESISELNGKVIPLTLQMLVENAIKHNVVSKQNPLNIKIYQGEKGWIRVENNLQPKIRPEESTHFGLNSLMIRYELVSGKKIKVQKNNTSFCVVIPLLNGD